MDTQYIFFGPHSHVRKQGPPGTQPSLDPININMEQQGDLWPHHSDLRQNNVE